MYGKIQSHEQILKTLDSLKSLGLTIVFTNGCFDLLHPGHIEYLAAAKALGDILIVGINDDDSVKRLKGAKRPINELDDRVIMLSALQAIDFVVPFSDDTPESLIKAIMPQILVKGGDYTKETIVGAKFVESQGGTVEIIPFKKGYSTTDLIENIKNL